MLRTSEIAAIAYKEGFIVGFDWRKGYVKSNIFR